jgi:hypothetical protein
LKKIVIGLEEEHWRAVVSSQSTALAHWLRCEGREGREKEDKVAEKFVDLREQRKLV